MIQSSKLLFKLEGGGKRAPFAGRLLYKADGQKQDERLYGQSQDQEKTVGAVQKSQDTAGNGSESQADAVDDSHGAVDLFQIPALLLPEIRLDLQSLDGAGAEGTADALHGTRGGQHEEMAAEHKEDVICYHETGRQ